MLVFNIGDGSDACLVVPTAPDFEGAVVGAAAFDLDFGAVRIGDAGFPVLLEGDAADVGFKGVEGGELLALVEGALGFGVEC